MTDYLTAIEVFAIHEDQIDMAEATVYGIVDCSKQPCSDRRLAIMRTWSRKPLPSGKAWRKILRSSTATSALLSL